MPPTVKTYCVHCAEPVSLSETGTLRDSDGLSYCAKAPNDAPWHKVAVRKPMLGSCFLCGRKGVAAVRRPGVRG
jgi:hypothetical protein